MSKKRRWCDFPGEDIAVNWRQRDCLNNDELETRSPIHLKREDKREAFWRSESITTGPAGGLNKAKQAEQRVANTALHPSIM